MQAKTLFAGVAAACALVIAAPACAQTSAQYSNTDGSVSPGAVISTSPDGRHTQPINPANPLPISGYDSGPVQATATPANSSHAAGTSVGGLFTLSMARAAGGSGEVTQVWWKSSGASTGSLVIRIWDKRPANTTCTDNSAFVGSATDDASLITPPFTLTPSAPGSATGDASTYASLTSVNFGFLNADTTPGKSLYGCAVTVAADTADENAAVYLGLDALQN